MIQIWKCENGEVEFESQEELERYFSGEKPELEFIKEGYYQAKYGNK